MRYLHLDLPNYPIAIHGVLEAAAERVALHRGKPWLGERRLREAGKAAAGDPHDLAAQERFEVHAGTEVPAGTGDDADTDIAIVLDLFACARQAFEIGRAHV